MRRPQAVNQGNLLPVRQRAGVDAGVFSQKLDRPLKDGLLEFQLSDLLLELPDLLFQLFGVVWQVNVVLWHPAGRLLSQ